MSKHTYTKDKSLFSEFESQLPITVKLLVRIIPWVLLYHVLTALTLSIASKVHSDILRDILALLIQPSLNWDILKRIHKNLIVGGVSRISAITVIIVLCPLIALATMESMFPINGTERSPVKIFIDYFMFLRNIITHREILSTVLLVFPTIIISIHITEMRRLSASIDKRGVPLDFYIREFKVVRFKETIRLKAKILKIILSSTIIPEIIVLIYVILLMLEHLVNILISILS